MGVTVVFAGLMLICLPGDTDCPVLSGKNTAWVVSASGSDMPCGWPNSARIYAELFLRYKKGDFRVNDYARICPPEPDGDMEFACKLSSYTELEIDIGGLENNYVTGRAAFLPRLSEVDERFKNIKETLGSYAPTTIVFPKATISASSLWSPKDSDLKPTPWFFCKKRVVQRVTLPPSLSADLTATYPISIVKIKNKKDDSTIIELTPIDEDRQFKIANEMNALPVETWRGHYELPFLLWYSRLGDWASGDCPKYDNDAVLFCCFGDKCYGGGDGKTTFWPVMRNSRP